MSPWAWRAAGRPGPAWSVFWPTIPWAQAAAGELRRWGVETQHLHFRTGRMGLYYLTQGAVLRPSEVTYDRAHSAFADADLELVDWDAALAGASWLHLVRGHPGGGDRTGRRRRSGQSRRRTA